MGVRAHQQAWSSDPVDEASLHNNTEEGQDDSSGMLLRQLFLMAPEALGEVLEVGVVLTHR